MYRWPSSDPARAYWPSGENTNRIIDFEQTDPVRTWRRSYLPSPGVRRSDGRMGDKDVPENITSAGRPACPEDIEGAVTGENSNEIGDGIVAKTGDRDRAQLSMDQMLQEAESGADR